MFIRWKRQLSVGSRPKRSKLKLLFALTRISNNPISRSNNSKSNIVILINNDVLKPQDNNYNCYLVASFQNLPATQHAVLLTHLCKLFVILKRLNIEATVASRQVKMQNKFFDKFFFIPIYRIFYPVKFNKGYLFFFVPATFFSEFLRTLSGI